MKINSGIDNTTTKMVILHLASLVVLSLLIVIVFQYKKFQTETTERRKVIREIYELYNSDSNKIDAMYKAMIKT